MKKSMKKSREGIDKKMGKNMKYRRGNAWILAIS
jgi:hypothetical protein